MAYEVKIPSQITKDAETITNKIVSLQGNRLHCTLYAQIEDSDTGSIIAGPVAFSAAVGKDETDRDIILAGLLKKQIAEWKDQVTNELAARATLTALETEVLKSEVADEKA